MSLRTIFRDADLRQLMARAQRLDAARPERWLDPFPELWLESGATWKREARAFRLHDAAGTQREHAFELLCGEPGGWTYLCASFLHHTLSELCADTPVERRARWLCARPAIDPRDEGIYGHELPIDWRPCVIEDNTRVTVRFHTRRGSGVFAHEDLYAAEGFELRTRELLLTRAEAS